MASNRADPGRDDAWSLVGRVAIVTGAGSGIGRASAVVLAEAGALVVCADVNGEGSAHTAKLAGEGAVGTTLDVTDRAAVHELVASTHAEHGRLDIVCNIAGIISSSDIIDLAEAEFDRIIAVNLKGVLFGAQAAAKVMAEAGRGSIVNMSSGAIDAPAAGLGAYAMSKAAIAQLTKTLAAEVGPRGVRVNAIAPGLVETAITERHYSKPDGSIDAERREATLAGMRAQSPLGIVGESVDIAYAVHYLVSDAARFVTGQIIRPNGGAMMPW
jgi:3-oxoacyl-[acyl-carrier protein] reductase